MYLKCNASVMNMLPHHHIRSCTKKIHWPCTFSYLYSVNDYKIYRYIYLYFSIANQLKIVYSDKTDEMHFSWFEIPNEHSVRNYTFFFSIIQKLLHLLRFYIANKIATALVFFSFRNIKILYMSVGK